MDSGIGLQPSHNVLQMMVALFAVLVLAADIVTQPCLEVYYHVLTLLMTGPELLIPCRSNR